MKKLTSLFALILLTIWVASPVVLAEGEGEEPEYSYGMVKSVTGDQLVVTEYDFETDADVDVSYTVQPGTEYEGVAAASEIAVGDSVEIDFVTQEGKKVASLVTVEKLTDEPLEPVAEPAPA